MKPYSPSCKLAVRDSLDDEYSDDVEDDVFIRDGKSAKVSRIGRGANPNGRRVFN